MFTTYLSSQSREVVLKNSLSSHGIQSVSFQSNLTHGDVIRGFFRCINPIVKRKRNGDRFIDLLLMHSSGSIRARVWDFVEVLMERLIDKDIVAVKGTIDEFDGEFYVKILSANSVVGKRYSMYGFRNSMIDSKILTLK